MGKNKKTNKNKKPITQKKATTTKTTTPKTNTVNSKTKFANKAKGGKKKLTAKKVIIIAALVVILLVLIAIGVFAGIFFSDKFAITREDLLIGFSNTIVYDSEGNVIAELSGDENRKIISMSEMSEYLPKAFVAIEDERFYKHSGVDVKRTAAATVTYVFRGGNSSFGGSTITQQLVKNMTNEKDKSGAAGIERKIKEMSRAYQIEKMISKDQILELYLNLIPLGASGKDLCGVEVASMYYFNKSASELSIEECAFLAGINHAPNRYNPYKGYDNADTIKTRTKTVLQKMKELKYITDEQYNEAIKNVDEGLKFSEGGLPSSTVTSYHLSAAINEVVKQLVNEKGMSEEYAKSCVYGGGYKIYTNQVSSIQSTLEEEYKKDKYIKKSRKTEGAHSQSAMVIIDHSTGKVVACVGGLGTDVNAVGLNRIFSARQPGSSIKPLGVYGAGIHYGTINAATIYDNSPTTFGTDYRPSSTSAKAGLCTIRDAIEVSSNVVACKILSEVGPDKSIDLLREFGITSLVKASEDNEYNDSNLSLALGGITKGISPLQMAAAYATIANKGVYITPSFYTKVEDSSGTVILESKQESRRVLTEQVAYMISSILRQPVVGSNGTARVCAISGMDVGAKTGTTNDNYDRWLCGFTPYYTGATWYGYDANKEEIVYSGNPSAQIWAAVMKNVHSGLPGKSFDKPSGIVTARVCRTSGKLATESCTNTYVEEFIEGTVPTACEGHVKYTVCNETGKIATEFCPGTHEVTGITIPEKEEKGAWKTNAGDRYTSITETCTVHTEAPKPTNPEPEKPPVSNNDFTVPNVVGKTTEEAKKALAELNVIIKEVDNGTPGKVMEQSQEPGTTMLKGGSITITVGKKPAATNTTP